MLSFLRGHKREIFSYWDGTGRRYADPLKLLRALSVDPEFNADRHADAAFEGDEEARALTIKAVQRAFGVHEFAHDGKSSGLTEKEMLELFASFCDYIGELKKNSSLMPISPPATEPERSAASTTTAR